MMPLQSQQAAHPVDMMAVQSASRAECWQMAAAQSIESILRRNLLQRFRIVRY